uniref:Uncharacterized protein n=1 Tax=Anguilla anguilla TaxID=7936 RepID=A0A0E9R2F3_ANGAN
MFCFDNLVFSHMNKLKCV